VQQNHPAHLVKTRVAIQALEPQSLNAGRDSLEIDGRSQRS
jgi:hypothetical protein